MRIVVMNGAATREEGHSLVALIRLDEQQHLHLEAEKSFPAKGAAEYFAPALQLLLKKCSWKAHSIDVVICVTGPGSFTGLRASLALAQGIVLGASCHAVGLDLGEVFLPLLRQSYPDLKALCLMQARHNRLFLQTPQSAWAQGIDEFAEPSVPTIVAGDGMLLLKERHITFPYLSFSEWVSPSALQIAAAGMKKQLLTKQDAMQALQPLYIDAPEAKLPADGLRPAPVSE